MGMVVAIKIWCGIGCIILLICGVGIGCIICGVGIKLCIPMLG